MISRIRPSEDEHSVGAFGCKTMTQPTLRASTQALSKLSEPHLRLLARARRRRRGVLWPLLEYLESS